MDKTIAASVDEHIARASAKAKPMLEELRTIIRQAAPGATESVSYGIPTFDLHGRHLVHFAGYAKHVSLYPTSSGVKAFEEELRPYPTGKGTIHFALDQPIPAELVRRIVEFRVREIELSEGTRRP